jgi:hypothetical protein
MVFSLVITTEAATSTPDDEKVTFMEMSALVLIDWIHTPQPQRRFRSRDLEEVRQNVSQQSSRASNQMSLDDRSYVW